MRVAQGMERGNKTFIILTTTVILFLLLLPAFAIEFKNNDDSFLRKMHSLFDSLLFFLLPLALFYKRIKIYFYLVLIWSLLAPFFLFSTLLFGVKPDTDLIMLALQTNLGEAQELAVGLKGIYIGVTLLYTCFYLLSVKKLPYHRSFAKIVIGISLFAAAFLTSDLVINTYIKKTDKAVYFRSFYPVSFLYDIYNTYDYFKTHSIQQGTNFCFDAYQKDTVAQRQIYVLIIGESSRYDKWQVNGYSRPTSPRLCQRKHLIVYPDVAAGGTLTYLSVPQMITRSNPDHMDTQYKEKSILSAFKDSGFKTAWLSNQSGRGVFTNGTITEHAQTADFTMFNLYEAKNSAHQYLDEQLLPVLDSFLNNTNGNVFIVLHTIGSHWNYTYRYPKSFDYFQPSGYEQSIYPTTEKNATAFLNTYDNSIRYSDYIIDSTISMVEKYNAVSSVFYISDHGEGLLEHNNYSKENRRKPSAATLHVPLFIWTSTQYQKAFPEKQSNLIKHKENKIGTENTFYTVLDMANIAFPGFDSTKSIANPHFVDNSQKYYIWRENKAYNYDMLIADSTATTVKAAMK